MLLFVSCALLPVTVLAVVSFYEVSSQLREESQRQLARASKSEGMALYERLQSLELDLRVLSSEIREHGSLDTPLVAQAHFEGLAVFAVDGRLRSHWGNPISFPRLTSAEKQHLVAGKSVVQSGTSSDGTGYVLMLRMVDAAKQNGPILIGAPDRDYLWAKSMSPELPFCVFSASRLILFCSDESLVAGGRALPAISTASGQYQWRNDGIQYDSAYWKLLLRPSFFESSWSISVSREHDQVLAPMLRFRRIFPLVIFLSLWIVLLASMVQIRRTLGPLEKLQEGTQRIGARQFDSRVEVSSGDEFESLAAAFNSMTAQLGRQFRTLETIRDIDQAIFASLDREAIVNGVLTRLPSVLPGDGFAVCTFEEAGSPGWARFFEAKTGQLQTIEARVTPVDWLQLNRNPVYLTLTAEEKLPAYLQRLSQVGMRSFKVWPIRVDNHLRAALICAYQSSNVPAFEHLHEASQIVDQLAVAFSHVFLIQKLERMHWATITALARAIDAKSNWTAGHSERVTDLAVEIGRNMGLGDNDLRVMKIGGLLHDIGKIGTPPNILDKPGKLTADEMRIMQEHVRTGIRILEPIPGFRDALPIIAQHHEWFNGKGYPEGIAGEEISLHARIFAVADSYDALTSDRPYRKGLPKHEVLSMLQERSGSQFDPHVIEAMLKITAGEAIQKSKAAFATETL